MNDLELKIALALFRQRHLKEEKGSMYGEVYPPHKFRISQNYKDANTVVFGALSPDENGETIPLVCFGHDPRLLALEYVAKLVYCKDGTARVYSETKYGLCPYPQWQQYLTLMKHPEWGNGSGSLNVIGLDKEDAIRELWMRLQQQLDGYLQKGVPNSVVYAAGDFIEKILTNPLLFAYVDKPFEPWTELLPTHWAFFKNKHF